MRKLFISVMLILPVISLLAQETSAESEIRKLEEQERRAVLKMDTATLFKLWDKLLIVNAPSNKVNLTGDDAVITRTGYASFTREIEQILVRGDVVFCMGNEVVMPAADNPKEGDEVRRRYTNVWMKQNGTWTLVARHVSVICGPKK